MTGAEVFGLIVGILAVMFMGMALAGDIGALLGFLVAAIGALIILNERTNRGRKSHG